MVRIFDYAVLQAVPDVVRGERVNVGVVVLKEDGLDVQVWESRKLQLLTGRSWDAFIDSFSKVLVEADDPRLPSKERVAKLALVQNQMVMSKVGWFEAANEEAYSKTVRDLVRQLVERPRQKRVREEPQVVSEISAELRAAHILAARDDRLDSGKVLRAYEIEPGLEADFVQLNSALHVASVLNLRASRPQLAQAALKAVVLDRAESVHEGKVHKIGVYAVAPARRGEVREHISILTRYADDVVNWEDPQDRKGLKRIFFDAYNSHVDATA